MKYEAAIITEKSENLIKVLSLLGGVNVITLDKTHTLIIGRKNQKLFDFLYSFLPLYSLHRSG